MTKWGKTVRQKVPFITFFFFFFSCVYVDCNEQFVTAIIVSTLDKTRIRQLGHGGTVQELSREMVWSLRQGSWSTGWWRLEWFFFFSFFNNTQPLKSEKHISGHLTYMPVTSLSVNAGFRFFFIYSAQHTHPSLLSTNTHHTVPGSLNITVSPLGN